MYDYHAMLGALALVVGVAGYVPYIRDTLKGSTKPHPFTYGIWAFVGAISFVAQILNNAGPGAWVSGIPVLFGIIVAILSVRKGEPPTKRDLKFLAGALAAIVIWRLTDDALYAVLIVIVINVFAVIPTFRKAYGKPDEETALSYSLGALRSVISIPALLSFNAVTLLPPICNIVSNVALVSMLLIRRKSLRR
ncbi:MAG TPA: hypothetical protein VMH91_03450 [Candidatus Paceibacterota bacterium]|nr:hypothetical protein [Candidatus Paceibacterota bacterium]